jgi:leucyl aminopeptidase
LEITVKTGDIAGAKAGAIVVNHFEGLRRLEGDAAAIDKALDGAISRLVREGEIKGKTGEVTVVYTLGKLPAERVAVVGLGKKTELSGDKIRGSVATACRLLRRKNVADVATTAQGVGIAGITAEGSGQAIAEGALLGLYTFRHHVTKESEFGEMKKLTILGDKDEVAGLRKGVSKGKVLSEAANLARDMVNEPSNHMTPTDMADMASWVAKNYGFEVNIYERPEIGKMGMGAFLGVARASQQPPRLIVLNYNGRGTGKPDVALVGKGVTFDSGGISIKPAEGMEDMKGDMAGGASVISAMGAIAQLKPRINVMAVVAATENLPGGNAIKPGDVLMSMAGKTIEIISTDAEGRLTLADAIAYAKKQGAKAIVDVATLTGAIRTSLGDQCSGGFTNNQALMDKVLAAGAEAGERIWQMPMYEEYKEQNKSEVADIRNTGGRLAGAITAAQFLAEFAGDTPWVHLDIAGTNLTDKEKNHLVKGATGVPVRTLVNLALALARE